jgi:hypothetical protein
MEALFQRTEHVVEVCFYFVGSASTSGFTSQRRKLDSHHALYALDTFSKHQTL